MLFIPTSFIIIINTTLNLIEKHFDTTIQVYFEQKNLILITVFFAIVVTSISIFLIITITFFKANLSNLLLKNKKSGNSPLIIPWSLEKEDLLIKAKNSLKQDKLTQVLDYLSQIKHQRLSEEIELITGRLIQLNQKIRQGIVSSEDAEV